MHRPKRSLGQNFLVDPNLQQKIVDGLAPDAGDEVLEIGPGTGALTRRIAGRVRRLVAVELDDALAADLEAELGGRDDVEIVHRDILEVDIADVASDPERLKVIGNIPYNITTPLIFRLLERHRRPAAMVLMIQREVADRILATPGTKAYGALSVGVRTVAAVERLFDVRRTAFRPMPDVDSTVIRITPIRPPPLEPHEEDALRTLTRVAFSRRRKQLQRILRSAPEYGLAAAEIESLARETGIDLEARPEDLAPADFIALTRALRGSSPQRREAERGDQRREAPGSARDSTTRGPARASAGRSTERANAGASSIGERSGDSGHLRLLGIVAHELRSPLTAIMGYQELVADGFYGSIEEAAAEPIRRIGHCARQLLTLIDGLEQLVRPPHDDADESRYTETTDADSAAALEDCLADARREAAALQIELDLHAPETLEPLRGDADRALSAIELVIHAALKLATADALRLAIEQDERRTVVTASGPGLDRYRLPAEIAAAPDADIDIDSGAALRLAIARRVAASLGGRLASSGTGEVATLVLELPPPTAGPGRHR